MCRRSPEIKIEKFCQMKWAPGKCVLQIVINFPAFDFLKMNWKVFSICRERRWIDIKMGNANAKVKPPICSNEHLFKIMQSNKIFPCQLEYSNLCNWFGYFRFFKIHYTTHTCSHSMCFFTNICICVECGYHRQYQHVWNWRSYRCWEQQYMPGINMIFDWSSKKMCEYLLCLN